ncbi:MAG: hypothetical protein KUG81_07695 [Gammaproteobacteria bacterium]|nr:hypothetical protein [Gammaproteobacteria bacterium]
MKEYSIDDITDAILRTMANANQQRNPMTQSSHDFISTINEIQNLTQEQAKQRNWYGHKHLIECFWLLNKYADRSDLPWSQVKISFPEEVHQLPHIEGNFHYLVKFLRTIYKEQTRDIEQKQRAFNKHAKSQRTQRTKNIDHLNKHATDQRPKRRPRLK